jgi:hypothetical protein
MNTSLTAISKLSTIAPIHWHDAEQTAMSAVVARHERESVADICAYLFQICKHYQTEYLDRQGITCRFDVADGSLPLWQCKILGHIVRTLMSAICAGRRAPRRNGTITVALRHRARVWILAIEDRGVRLPGHALVDRELGLRRSFAQSLNAVWRLRPTESGSLATLLFLAE